MIAHLSNIQKVSPEVEFESQPLGLGQNERWFVARTLSYRENGAQFNVNRLGFRTYFPTLRRTVRHARKTRNVLAPLFPGYLFVILDLSRDRWRSINGAIGVASLIMGAEKPIQVPRGVIEALIATREVSGAVRLDQDLEIGQKVRILSGPFADALCRLEHLDDRGRVCVLLEIMGGHVAAYLDRTAVAPST